jgi:CDP-glucose 4,6-dehydratase
VGEREGAVEGLDLTRTFGGAYRGARVAITGHTGFKGSWLALWLEAAGAEVHGMALAPDTEPSHHAVLGRRSEPEVDLTDAAATRDALAAARPDVVFHLAAQSLVRRGYRDPALTWRTNVMGLVHLLEAVRDVSSVRAIVHATSDKCYENREWVWGYRESDRLGGRDPYSASKACGEIVTASYRDSFLAADDGRGRPVLVATARAGNVVGGGDWAEDRLVPDLVRAAAAGRATAVRRPGARRPWQHVLDPLAGYLLLGQRLLDGDASAAGAWNFGPSEDGALTVREVVERMAHAWGAVRYETDSAEHPHEAGTLVLDCSKARHGLGWRPVWNQDETFARTAAWYRAYYEAGAVRTRDDLAAYVRDAAEAGQAWAAP